ncbi:MAG: PadR family transcriptional regulator, partial [Desulfobacterota bacterium]|nr:PadR family transcriptional regulator [Thermodesulfobacteriota bacterium]
IDQEPKYAYEIKQKVYQITGNTFDIDRNNLYKKLRTLEREGILKSFNKPSSKGADRKYYALTPFGKKFYRDIASLMKPVIDSFYERMRHIPLK